MNYLKWHSTILQTSMSIYVTIVNPPKVIIPTSMHLIIILQYCLFRVYRHNLTVIVRVNREGKSEFICDMFMFCEKHFIFSNNI